MPVRFQSAIAAGGSPSTPARSAKRWIVAGAAAIAAVGARAVLAPWLGDAVPFVFAFPAIALVGLYAGLGPAVLVALLCSAWALAPWVDSTSQVSVGNLPVLLFLPSALLVAFFCGRVGPGAHRRAGLSATTSAPVAGRAPGADNASSEQQFTNAAASRWLLASIAAAAVVPGALFAFAAWTSYHDAFAEAAVRVDRTMRIAHEHAVKVFETNEVVQGRVADLLREVPDEFVRMREQEVHHELKYIVEGIAQIQGVWVWNSQGYPLVSSAAYPVAREVNTSDRDYFAHHRHAGQGTFISAPYRGRITQERLFSVSHRRNLDGNRFAGIVSVALYPHYFTEFYSELARAEPSLSVSLLRADGTLLSRMPSAPGDLVQLPPTSPVMQRIEAGSMSGQFHAISSVDGEQRLVSYRKIKHYPLYVVGGITHEAILASWYQYIRVLAAFTFPTALLLMYVCWVALHRARREFSVLEQLRAEIARRTQVEEALRQAQKLEALGHLTGGVAHDVNNLLMVVNNNAHVLKRILPADARSRAESQIAAILRAVGAGTRLTRQLLAFSRRQALRPEVIRLQERLPALLELIRHSMTSQIELSGQVDPQTAAVEVDPAELELALINLAVNAKDAMPDGGSVTLRIRNAAPGEVPELAGRFVVVAVCDTGAGIAADVLDRVFEPFFTTKETGKGTGLGLSQVFGFCTQSGGTARVASQPGVGTVVSMYLPASDKSPVDEKPLQSPAVVARGRLLLVEDNVEVAEATVPLLQSFGYEVTLEPSADAAAGLLARQAQALDVVLTDIVMPGTLDGLGLARLVRQKYPELPVVLMTGYSSQLDRAIGEGFDVLPKPWQPEALAAVLAKVARKPKESAAR